MLWMSKFWEMGFRLQAFPLKVQGPDCVLCLGLNEMRQGSPSEEFRFQASRASDGPELQSP